MQGVSTIKLMKHINVNGLSDFPFSPRFTVQYFDLPCMKDFTLLIQFFLIYNVSIFHCTVHHLLVNYERKDIQNLT